MLSGLVPMNMFGWFYDLFFTFKFQGFCKQGRLPLPHQYAFLVRDLSIPIDILQRTNIGPQIRQELFNQRSDTPQLRIGGYQWLGNGGWGHQSNESQWEVCCPTNQTETASTHNQGTCRSSIDVSFIEYERWDGLGLSGLFVNILWRNEECIWESVQRKWVTSYPRWQMS